MLQAYKDIFNAPQNLKSTYLSKEQVKNGEINGFQWSINNPAGYVLKYINKSFINCLENKELNHQQAWYIKYKVRRFTTSRHQIPLWIYRKINFFKKDFYNLCLLKDHSDWFCEWDYSSQYFRLSNIKTTELINYENGVLEYSIQDKIIHRYEKKNSSLENGNSRNQESLFRKPAKNSKTSCASSAKAKSPAKKHSA